MVACQQANTLTIRRAPTPANWVDLRVTLGKLLADVNPDDVSGMGVGVAGVLRDDGTCWTPNVPATDGLPLKTMLQQDWPVPIDVDNDAKMALRAEIAIPPLSQADPVLLLAIGTGIGGALKANGRIVQGHHRSAGAFGWLGILTPSAAGVWEDLASGRALDAIARQLHLADGQALVIQAHQGDPASLDAIIPWFNAVGTGLASLINIIDPQVVVVTGGIASQGDWFLQKLQQAVAGHTSPLTRDTPIQIARTGAEAVARGALWAAQHVLDQPSGR